MEDFLKVEEVAEALKVCPRTVLNYVNHKQIRGRRIGRRIYITKEELNSFLEKGKEKNYLSL